MRSVAMVMLALAVVFMGGCGSSGGGIEGTFYLVQFLESGKDSIPRNRELIFKFSAPVGTQQDFAERLKIQNVQAGQGQSDFSRAIGVYLVAGDQVTFIPRLPNVSDRSDAGFRSEGDYEVFLKGGPDSLEGTGGDKLGSPQHFIFSTSQYFEDPISIEPPRVLGLVARDPTTNAATDLSRLDPRPSELAKLPNGDLLAANRFIDPGAGGAAANYDVHWNFELELSEPIDPATVTTDAIELLEIHEDATDSPEEDPPTAGPGHVPTINGHPFRVPIDVEPVQTTLGDGSYHAIIRVTPGVTLVDDTRYRLVFSGSILGIDFRKAFIGENGLTGDGQTQLGSGEVFAEPGGLGYATEFIVRDRAPIDGVRVLMFDPALDGIEPEKGQSVLDESRYNTSLYNDPSNPGTAVGFLADFGDGRDGPLAVSSGNTTVIHTGDTENAFVGNPFAVDDLNPNDTYNKKTLGTGSLTYDSPEFYELNLESLTISSSSTLRFTGVNPVLLRVTGLVQISGLLDLSGGDGENGTSGSRSLGGEAGAGGAPGGESRRGVSYYYHTHSKLSWAQLLQYNSTIRNNGPYSDNGYGPGRGLRGGEAYNYYPCNDAKDGQTGTGGGGASHALAGQKGEDRLNANGTVGTAGPSYCWVHCGTKGGFTNESIIGVRGMPGPTYGDREVIKVTLGGSGGGAGGNEHGRYRASGGGGGGGGGSISILAAGPILVQGGRISARGGNGGKGYLNKPNSSLAWATGGGGGGSGGSVVLISGADIDLTAGLVDARGGLGGDRGDVGTTPLFGGTNAGGDGGNGYIFMMDADGLITGFLPGQPGEYDNHAYGFLTIKEFVADRFGSIAAVTELFNVQASNPMYRNLETTGIQGKVSTGQVIHIFASSAKGDPLKPLRANLGTETGPVEVAQIRRAAAGIVVEITGDMSALNPGGLPDREAFVRIDARFEYSNLVEAVLGPLAYIDRVEIPFQFN